jgi:hypothetical protein
MKWSSSTIITLIIVAASVVGSYAVAQYQISELRGDVQKLQEQRDIDRESLIEMRADVRWIRLTLERNGLKP